MKIVSKLVKTFTFIFMVFLINVWTLAYSAVEGREVGDTSLGYWKQLPFPDGCPFIGGPAENSSWPTWPPGPISERAYTISGNYKLTSIVKMVGWSFWDPPQCNLPHENCITGFEEAFATAHMNQNKSIVHPNVSITTSGNLFIQTNGVSIDGIETVMYLRMCASNFSYEEWIWNEDPLPLKQGNQGPPEVCQRRQ
jgi:hypothetical protein